MSSRRKIRRNDRPNARAVTQTAGLADRYAALAGAGPGGQARRLADQAVRSALAGDNAELARVTATACADPALAGVVLGILAHSAAHLSAQLADEAAANEAAADEAGQD